MSFALITGASKGIGKAFAQNLAARKYDLLLVARSEDELKKVCDEIREKYSVDCRYLACDLSKPDAAKKIESWISENQYNVSVLINNAGFGLWGAFHEHSLEEQNEIIAVNISALISITHRLIPYLRKQPKAYILNVGSSSAYQAMPTFSVYAASKSFVVSFTRALHHELKGTNISVSCLTPGSVKTNFVNRARMPHMQEIADKVSDEPDAVAKAGLRAMFAGKIESIPGFLNYTGVFMNRLIPKAVAEKFVAKMYMKKEK